MLLMQRADSQSNWQNRSTATTTDMQTATNDVKIATPLKVKQAIDFHAYNKAAADAQFFSRSNIVGTVSQSGGVPTGAIIERGSNVNGEYTKYADGTFEFYRLLPFSSYNGSQGYKLSLPVAAIERPVIIPCYRQNGTNFVIVKDNNIQTDVTTEYEIAFSASTGANGTASVFGYGRWY